MCHNRLGNPAGDKIPNFNATIVAPDGNQAASSIELEGYNKCGTTTVFYPFQVAIRSFRVVLMKSLCKGKIERVTRANVGRQRGGIQ